MHRYICRYVKFYVLSDKRLQSDMETDYEGSHSRVAIRFGKPGRINQKFGKQYVS